jgi:hypothetical protein
MTTNTDRALALLDTADARIEDADAIRAAIVELVERINAELVLIDPTPAPTSAATCSPPPNASRPTPWR